MSANLPTLMTAASFVAAVSGMFLVFAWFQDRRSTGPLWWGASNLVLAAAVPVLAASGAPFGVPATILGLTLFDLSTALIWGAALACNQRPLNPGLAAAGGAIWLFALALVAQLSPDAQMTVCFGVAAAYTFAAALEFWYGGAERIQARWPLCILLVLHASFFAIGSLLALFEGVTAGGTASTDTWFYLIHFETLAFVVGTAIFAVAMGKERIELANAAAASIDPLTGTATRRAFLQQAERLLHEHVATGAPLSLVMFDLDRFKAINDSLGHAMGDRVLETFGRTALGSLRTVDCIGRPGGEEFAIMMPGTTTGAAFVAADRIRESFAEACRVLELGRCAPTASAGIATADSRSTLDSLFAAADRALYAAKANGRNLVAIADAEAQQRPAPTAEIRRIGIRAA